MVLNSRPLGIRGIANALLQGRPHEHPGNQCQWTPAGHCRVRAIVAQRFTKAYRQCVRSTQEPFLCASKESLLTDDFLQRIGPPRWAP